MSGLVRSAAGLVSRILGTTMAPREEVQKTIAKLMELDEAILPHPKVTDALRNNADLIPEPSDEWKQYRSDSYRYNVLEKVLAGWNWKRPIEIPPPKYEDDDMYTLSHDLLAVIRMHELGYKTPEQQVDFLSKVGISPGVFSLEWVYDNPVPAHTFTELPIVKESGIDEVTGLVKTPVHHKKHKHKD